jgi:hypothetical protein
VACVFEVAGGMLLHERLYWDRANTMRQLKAAPCNCERRNGAGRRVSMT